MLKKKISELEPKTDLAPTDAIPVVDTELVRKKTKQTTIADIVAVVDAVPNDARGAAGGVATLDSSGQLPTEQLPPEATIEIFTVVSETAMLALGAQTGDVAIRTDVNKTFILAGDNPASLNHWQEIIVPTPNLLSLPDVSPSAPDVRAALIYDPETNLWRSADIAKLTDGGSF